MIPSAVLISIMKMLLVITRLFGLRLSAPTGTSEYVALAKAAKWQERVTFTTQPITWRDASALALIFAEVWRVRSMHGPYFSPHHGISIIREEFDELWEEVREDSHDIDMQIEATQLGSTVVRFIADLCRVGCPPCADRTCEDHRAQDQGCDYEMTKDDWDGQRRLYAVSTKELQAELARRTARKGGKS